MKENENLSVFSLGQIEETCMKFKARWLRGLASWLAVNMAAMLTTFVPFAQADPLVRLGFVLSVAVACVVLFCRSER